MTDELTRLRRLVLALAERVAVQSELLSRRAERPAGPEQGVSMGKANDSPADPRTLPEQMAGALRDAHRDIREWVALAERQRAEIPDANFCPYAPTTHGIAESSAVLSNIAQAIARYNRELRPDREGGG